MPNLRFLTAALLAALALPVEAHEAPVRRDPALRNVYDRARAPELARRAADWRNGAVVYQVLVDRFAPSRKLAQKQALYAAPRKLRAWSEVPKAGQYVPGAEVWSHEIDFWGGDLDSLKGKLGWVDDLGADVLYLNPVFASFTNHKYDAWDYHQVDPAFGTRAELKGLVDEAHRRGMKVVLDGVFNHMGRKSPYFQQALKDPRSKWRPFYKFRPGNPPYVGWMDVANLPELNLEDRRVQDYVYKRPDSVLQSYVRREGVDGWRLDVAFDIGFTLLADMNRALKTARRDTVLIGEIWDYPEEWSPAVDGVMDMHGRAAILAMLQGKVAGPVASAMWDTMIQDAGLEPILKSWLVFDNHDTPRLATSLSQPWQVKMARTLQMTLPGSPCLYYGSELGMTGGDDPEQRAPMRWDLATGGNETLALHRQLLKMRKAEPALRYGDFRRLHSSQLFAFLRRTDSVKDTVVVLANPTDQPVTEVIQLRESKFHDYSDLQDVLTGRKLKVLGSFVEAPVGPHEVLVMKMDTRPYPNGYDRYDREY